MLNINKKITSDIYLSIDIVRNMFNKVQIIVSKPRLPFLSFHHDFCAICRKIVRSH